MAEISLITYIVELQAPLFMSVGQRKHRKNGEKRRGFKMRCGISGYRKTQHIFKVLHSPRVAEVDCVAISLTNDDGIRQQQCYLTKTQQ